MGVGPNLKWLMVMPPDFFGVVDKIPLGIQVCFVADDLDGVLGANCSGLSQTPELAANYAFRRSVRSARLPPKSSSYVVDDSNSEVVFRRVLGEVVEDCLHHGRGKLFGTKAAAAAHGEDLFARLLQHSADVFIERFANLSQALWRDSKQ